MIDDRLENTAGVPQADDDLTPFEHWLGRNVAPQSQEPLWAAEGTLEERAKTRRFIEWVDLNCPSYSAAARRV